MNSFKRALARFVQKHFWVYLTEVFDIRTMADFKMIDGRIPCSLVAITADNAHRVKEFRETERVAQYRDKVANGEIGCFAESDGKVVGSIWATVNHAPIPIIVRRYMPLKPNEALIHDIVTSDLHRGKNVGPFMVARLASVLLRSHGVSRIVIDVNTRNTSSIRMMEKVGLRAQEQVLYVSVAGTLAFRKTLKRYSPCCASLDAQELTSMHR